MSNSKSESVDAALYADETQRRQQPGFSELRRPGYLLKWLWAFVEGWFLSRNYRQLAIGLPFLLIAFGGPMFVWWLKSAPRDSLVMAYESAVEDAVRNEEPEKTGVYLESLVQLRPLRKEFRHQLAMHYVQEGQPDRAGVHLNSLTGPDGYVPTRLWLIQQADDADPDFPLSDEQIDAQLGRILEKQPMNTIANWRLADRLLQKQQFRTAEDHLLKIVDRIPALGLPLARVQMALKRDKEQVLSHLAVADEFFQKALLADGKDAESRVQRAEVLMLKNDLAGAAELIAEGRRLEDNNQLRVANAELLKAQVSQKLGASALNAPDAARDLLLAMKLNPGDRTLLRQALAFIRLGVKWSPAQLQPSLDVLLQEPELGTADRQLLLAGLTATGQNKKALEVVASVAQPEFSDRVFEAEILIREGQNEKADVLLTEMLAESEAAEDIGSCLNRTKVLLLLNRHVEAHRFIQECQEKFTGVPQEQVADWKAYFRQANLAVYRERLANDEFEDAADAIRMLTDPRQGAVNVLDVVGLMVGLMNARPDFAPAVRETMKQLAQSNRSGWQIYKLLGTYDLQRSQDDPSLLKGALTSLELAYQSKKNDPMLMNNLAVALVRNNGDLGRARELAEGAMGKLSNPVEAMSTRAEISVAEERWEEALADLELALAERPNSANVRQLLVKVLTALGKPDLAEEHQKVYNQLTNAEQKDDGSVEGQ